MIPLYKELVDVNDAAFVIKRINNGIQGEHFPATNTELLALIVEGEEKTKLELPRGYQPAVFSRELLENDFRKNLLCYEWCPDPEAWRLANEAARKITRGFLQGHLRELDDILPLVDRTTSPGYPLNLKYKNKGDALDGEMPLLREIINQIRLTGKFRVIFCVRLGLSIVWDHVYWSVSPKGELRTSDKLLNPDVKKRKTRTFMCGDLLMHLVNLMVFSDQNDSFLAMANEREWSAVGMTPWYGGWNSMSQYLLSGKDKDPDFICFDVEHMEASVNDSFQTEIDEDRFDNIVLDSAVGSSDRVADCNLMTFAHRGVTELYIIGPDGWLYFRCCVNPSGKLNTATDNTMALLRLFLYIIARYLGEAVLCNTTGMSVSKILQVYYSTPAKIYGDDSIFQMRGWLLRAIEFGRELGFSLKLECPISKLSGAKFLNAGFHRGDTGWLFRPNFDKIRASILFLWKARSWRYCWVKICAYRQLVYPYADYRAEADRMLRYIERHHDKDMRMEVQHDSALTYASCKASLMPNAQNEFLSMGYEGGCTTNPSLVYRGIFRWTAAGSHGSLNIFDVE